jgi:allophanate hydrolase
MIPPAAFTLDALHAFFAAGGSPLAVADAALARIDAWDDPALFLARIPPEAVRARAAALAAEGPRGRPLFGMPFVVKDNIDAAGLPTTAGCPDYAYHPQADSPAVARLLAAGAVLLGKTNLDQFATGLNGTRSPHGTPRNPVAADCIPGGSSSGSATAVAAGIAGFSLGTDTAGSGRVPAMANNIVGLKPSLGLVPTEGVVPACRSLDCVSVFALTVADAGAVLQVLAGPAPTDRYSRAAPPAGRPPRRRSPPGGWPRRWPGNWSSIRRTMPLCTPPRWPEPRPWAAASPASTSRPSWRLPGGCTKAPGWRNAPPRCAAWWNGTRTACIPSPG